LGAYLVDKMDLWICRGPEFGTTWIKKFTHRNPRPRPVIALLETSQVSGAFVEGKCYPKPVDGRNPKQPLGMFLALLKISMFYHFNWCRISSINRISQNIPKYHISG